MDEILEQSVGKTIEKIERGSTYIVILFDDGTELQISALGGDSVIGVN